MLPLWRFYYVRNCRHARPVPKDKFIAIVCSTPKPMGFLVNTDIHPFIKSMPHLLSGQVSISATEYEFLDHDSYIDCVNLYSFEWSELTSERQHINDGTGAQIRGAVAISETIIEMMIKIICGK